MSPEDCAAVVHAHASRVQGWAAKYAPKGVDPRDVAQEVFRVFYARREDVVAPAVRDFLHTTTWNVCLDLKKRAARRARLGEVLVDVVPDVPASIDIEATLAGAELHEHLREAMERLAVQERRVTQRIVVDGVSAADVAREEKLPESTVRSRLRSALDRVRRGLLRERREEKARTGGYASWGLMWAVVGWNARTVAWVARARALFTKAWPKFVAFAGAVTGVSAIVASVALLTGGAPAGAALQVDAEELPAVAFEAPLLSFEPSVPRAPSSVEKAEPANTAPERPALGPRRRHDAHAHFEQQAFGDAAKRP